MRNKSVHISIILITLLVGLVSCKVSKDIQDDSIQVEAEANPENAESGADIGNGSGKALTKDQSVKLDCINPLLIKKNMQCTDLYDPVCGCNNVTYSNKCEAQKAGVKKFKKGKCVKTAKM